MQHCKMDFKTVSELRHPQDWVEWVAFCPDGTFLATCSGDVVIVWKISNSCPVAQLSHSQSVWKIVFSRRESKLLCACGDGKLYIWSGMNFSNLSKTIQAHSMPMFGIVGHPKLDLVATASQDCTVKIHDLGQSSQSNPLLTLKGHSDTVEHVDFSPDGTALCSCSKDKTLRLRELDSQCKNCISVKIGRGHKHWVYCCTFSNDGALLASSSADKTIRIWDPLSMKTLQVLQGHSNIVWCCNFLHSPDSVLISCSSDRSLRAWDPRRGQQLGIIKNLGGTSDGSGQLFCCSYDDKSNHVALSSYHGNVYIISMGNESMQNKG